MTIGCLVIWLFLSLGLGEDALWLTRPGEDERVLDRSEQTTDGGLVTTMDGPVMPPPPPPK